MAVSSYNVAGIMDCTYSVLQLRDIMVVSNYIFTHGCVHRKDRYTKCQISLLMVVCTEKTGTQNSSTFYSW